MSLALCAAARKRASQPGRDHGVGVEQHGVVAGGEAQADIGRTGEAAVDGFDLQQDVAALGEGGEGGDQFGVGRGVGDDDDALALNEVCAPRRRCRPA